jgi:hypothetical protein
MILNSFKVLSEVQGVSVGQFDGPDDLYTLIETHNAYARFGSNTRRRLLTIAALAVAAIEDYDNRIKRRSADDAGAVRQGDGPIRHSPYTAVYNDWD